MLKEILTHLNLGDLISAGMVIFFICFLAILFYALTRSPEQAKRWARLPLNVEEDAPRTEARNSHE